MFCNNTLPVFKRSLDQSELPGKHLCQLAHGQAVDHLDREQLLLAGEHQLHQHLHVPVRGLAQSGQLGRVELGDGRSADYEVRLAPLLHAGHVALHHLHTHPQPRPGPAHLPLSLLVGQLPEGALQQLCVRPDGDSLPQALVERFGVLLDLESAAGPCPGPLLGWVTKGWP